MLMTYIACSLWSTKKIALSEDHVCLSVIAFICDLVSVTIPLVGNLVQEFLTEIFQASMSLVKMRTMTLTETQKAVPFLLAYIKLHLHVYHEAICYAETTEFLSKICVLWDLRSFWILCGVESQKSEDLTPWQKSYIYIYIYIYIYVYYVWSMHL